MIILKRLQVRPVGRTGMSSPKKSLIALMLFELESSESSSQHRATRQVRCVAAPGLPHLCCAANFTAGDGGPVDRHGAPGPWVQRVGIGKKAVRKSVNI